MSAARPLRTAHQPASRSPRWRGQYPRHFESSLPKLRAQGNGCGLNDIGFQPVGEIVAVEQDRQPSRIGYDLMQKLEPIAGEIGILGRQSGEIAARMRQASN